MKNFPRPLLLVVLISSGISACEFIIPSLRRDYNDYLIVNHCNSAVTVKAYYQRSVIDGFVIRRGHFHRQLIDERRNQSIFHSELPDSVVVIHESTQKQIIDYCGGKILIEDSCRFQNIKSIARMGTVPENVFIQKVRKRIDGKYIAYRYTITLEDADFE